MKTLRFIILLCGLLGLAVSLVLVAPVGAEAEQPEPPTQAADNDTCLTCHAAPNQVTEFPSGEPLYITIDPDVFYSSVHGEAGYACVQCHTDVTGYPHPPLGATSRREYAVLNYTACARCSRFPC